MTTPERKRIYAQYEKQLTPFSTSLVAEFRRSAEAISDIVSDDELRQWAEEGMDLARQSWRSAAGEFYRHFRSSRHPVHAFTRWRSTTATAELSSAPLCLLPASPETVPAVGFARWATGKLGRLV